MLYLTNNFGELLSNLSLNCHEKNAGIYTYSNSFKLFNVKMCFNEEIFPSHPNFDKLNDASFILNGQQNLRTKNETVQRRLKDFFTENVNLKINQDTHE